MPPLPVDDHTYREGRALYHGGNSARIVFEMCERMRASLHDAPLSSEPLDYRLLESKAKSLCLGYVDGFIDDVRKIANGTRGGGTRA